MHILAERFFLFLRSLIGYFHTYIIPDLPAYIQAYIGLFNHACANVYIYIYMLVNIGYVNTYLLEYVYIWINISTSAYLRA
jgi:hypothetical protein